MIIIINTTNPNSIKTYAFDGYALNTREIDKINTYQLNPIETALITPIPIPHTTPHI